MRQAPDKLRQLIEPVVEGLGYEAVGVVYLAQGRHGLLRIYIDRPDGITLDDCERVSHQVSGVLDVADPIGDQYTLEVSSPGIDRPLFRIGDFARFAGQRVKLRLAGRGRERSRYTGTLLGVAGDEVSVEVDGETVRVAFDDIEQAQLVGEVRPRRAKSGESEG